MITNTLKPLTIAMLAVSTAGLSGCDSDSSSSGDEGTFSLALTDAPTQQFNAVNITVTGVALQPADGDRVSFEFDSPKNLDLLNYQNGDSVALLENQRVPAGEYNWMRLKLDTDNLSVEDSEGEKTLFIPSGEQTGLKTSGFTVAQNSQTSYTIDFDASKSIVNPQGETPDNADYLLNPVLRLVNNLETGTISGQVGSNLLSDCENDGGLVYVYTGAEATIGDLGSDNEPLSIATVETDSETSDFVYTAAFLEEGDYTLSHTCDADDNEQDEDLAFSSGETVSVTAGETTEHNLSADQ
ncbi:DUF4382 domain-containing protein [Halomonadaceae bacterium KBTZ08]